MRIRTIKPSFWTNEKMSRLPDFARLLAIGLLNYADDHGYFWANPLLVRGALFPFEEDSSKVLKGLSELASEGFIVLGLTPDGRACGKVVNFSTHQRVDKPQESVIQPIADFQDNSENVLGTIQDKSALYGKGKEGKGRERIHTSPPPAASGQEGLTLVLDDVPVAPGMARLRARDPLIDALAAVDGSDPQQVTGSAWPTIATALKHIRAVTPDVTPEEIRRRRDNYVANHPTWACTPPAIAKHWAASATRQPQLQNANHGQRSSRSFDNQQDYSDVTEKL